MRPALPLTIAAAWLLPGTTLAADDADRQIEALRAQVQEREAEVAALRRQITALRRQHPQAATAEAASTASPAPAMEEPALSAQVNSAEPSPAVASPPEPPAAVARPVPAVGAAAPSVPPAMLEALLRRGHAMLAVGDISAARLLYAHAAMAGSGAAATAMGGTYDPAVLAGVGARGVQPDRAAAAAWYRRAAALGDREAAEARAVGGADRQVEALRAQLRQREAEAAALRRQRPQTDSAATLSNRHLESTSPAQAAAVAPLPPRPVPSTTSGSAEEEEMLSSALESALVRQGGRVLSQGTVEIEPEVSYLYDEPIRGQRRDNYSAALTARFGLPWSMQAEVRVPYVLSDRWTGVGTSSGISDIRLGLTKELVTEREWVPALLAFVQWRTTTGDINRNPSTGFGQNAVQFGLTAAKRQDPIVLFGSLGYTANLGSGARLRSGSRLDNGDIFSGRLGSFLSVTPDISMLLAISANSFSADRFGGLRSPASDRLRGVVEIGAVATIARGLFLNVTAGIGVTPAAPDFALTVSLPYRF